MKCCSVYLLVLMSFGIQAQEILSDSHEVIMSIPQEGLTVSSDEYNLDPILKYETYLRSDVSLALYDRDTTNVKLKKTEIIEESNKWFIHAYFQKGNDQILYKVRLIKQKNDLLISKSLNGEICMCSSCDLLGIDSITHNCKTGESKRNGKKIATVHRLVSSLN